MSNHDIRTENPDAFDAKGPSDYDYGWPKIFSIFDDTSVQEAQYREVSKQYPLGTILVQVNADRGDLKTIYETIPHGSDFLLGSRFMNQEVKTPAGIILFSKPQPALSIPNYISQIDQSMPAVIKFWDSAGQTRTLRTLNLNDYASGGEYINWAKILRDIGASDLFQLSYTDERHREWKNTISKKPVIGWDEFDLTSPMSFETGVKPGLQYFSHGGHRVVSIINVREERDKIRNFIGQNAPQNGGDIDSFAAEARSHAEMLGKIFHGLTGTRNSSLYTHIYKLAGGFKEKINEMIDANPALARNPDLQAALSSLDLKIPKVHFVGESRKTFSLEDAESNGNVSPEVISHLRQVGQLSGGSVANNPVIDRAISPGPSTEVAQAAFDNRRTALQQQQQQRQHMPDGEQRMAARALQDQQREAQRLAMEARRSTLPEPAALPSEGIAADPLRLPTGTMRIAGAGAITAITVLPTAIAVGEDIKNGQYVSAAHSTGHFVDDAMAAGVCATAVEGPAAPLLAGGPFGAVAYGVVVLGAGATCATATELSLNLSEAALGKLVPPSHPVQAAPDAGKVK